MQIHEADLGVIQGPLFSFFSVPMSIPVLLLFCVLSVCKPNLQIN